jgi:hypothetical protein
MARAGCVSGMLSAVKLCQSSSISGPLATAKPMSAKISASSSITCRWGCRARAFRRGQRQVHRFGRQARIERGAFQRALRAASAVVTASRAPWICGPWPGALRAHLAHGLEQGGNPALLAERGHADRLQRIERGGRGNGAERFGLLLI